MLSAMMAHPHGPPVAPNGGGFGPPAAHNGGGFGTDSVSLPLNLLVTIISYLDDPADLARACRTCRILHYMCLPKLYSNVILRSYDHIRYSEETMAPEGMGGGSPFVMGINALVTGNVTQYVKRFELTGELQEFGLEENAEAGRVADGPMMLSLLIRTCIDRMPKLRTFNWTLKTKMLPTVWYGLAAQKDLDSLTVRMPSLRLPMPTVMAPTLPNLTYLHVMDIDPACYPDNIGELLFNARKLQHLKLHFSPRMRREREPSISLESFFGRVKTSNYRMTIKTLALQNLYAGTGGNYTDMYDHTIIESITLIDSSGGADNDASMSFVAHLPIKMPQMSSIRMLRGNKASLRHAQTLRGMIRTLHSYFLITGRPLKDIPLSPSSVGPNGSISQLNSPQSVETPSVGSSPKSPAEVSGSSGRRSSSIAVGDKHARSEAAIANLLPHYVDSICAEQRQHLHKILLFPQFKFTSDHLTRLVRYCPNLQELGLASEPPPLDVIHYLAPHLPKLTALRILNIPNFTEVEDNLAAVTEWYEARIGAAAWNKKNSTLRWIGIGDLIFELTNGPDVEVEIDGNKRKARSVRRVLSSRVAKVEIWATDVLKI